MHLKLEAAYFGFEGTRHPFFPIFVKTSAAAGAKTCPGVVADAATRATLALRSSRLGVAVVENVIVPGKPFAATIV